MRPFLIPLGLAALACSACSSSLTREQGLYNAINDSADSHAAIARFAQLSKKLSASRDPAIQEVALRSAINQTSLLLSEQDFRQVLAVTQNAISRFQGHVSPGIRSRVVSLLLNQSVAWNGLHERDQEYAVLQRIRTDYAADTYPTTIILTAMASLGQADILLARRQTVQAEQMLLDFERDYIDSGRLGLEAPDPMQAACNGGSTSEVECVEGTPDLDYFKAQLARYQHALCAKKKDCHWNTNAQTRSGSPAQAKTYSK